MHVTDGETDQTQYLTFTLAGEEYGLPILRVKEIMEYESPTRVPMTPASVRGVINVRGSVVPVLDLAVKFGLPQSPITNRHCIVIVEVEVEGEDTVMGVIADAVSEVREFAPQDIEPPPSFGTAVRVEFLRGMGKVGKRFVLLLDVDRVLSATDRQAVAELQGAVEGPAAPAAGAPAG
jgi:purine-binding chemotaxis protein CheW